MDFFFEAGAVIVTFSLQVPVFKPLTLFPPGVEHALGVSGVAFIFDLGATEMPKDLKTDVILTELPTRTTAIRSTLLVDPTATVVDDDVVVLPVVFDPGVDVFVVVVVVFGSPVVGTNTLVVVGPTSSARSETLVGVASEPTDSPLPIWPDSL